MRLRRHVRRARLGLRQVRRFAAASALELAGHYLVDRSCRPAPVEAPSPMTPLLRFASLSAGLYLVRRSQVRRWGRIVNGEEMKARLDALDEHHGNPGWTRRLFGW